MQLSSKIIILRDCGIARRQPSTTAEPPGALQARLRKTPMRAGSCPAQCHPGAPVACTPSWRGPQRTAMGTCRPNLAQFPPGS